MKVTPWKRVLNGDISLFNIDLNLYPSIFFITEFIRAIKNINEIKAGLFHIAAIFWLQQGLFRREFLQKKKT